MAECDSVWQSNDQPGIASMRRVLFPRQSTSENRHATTTDEIALKIEYLFEAGRQ